jgi:hypothetical protein
VPTPGIELWLFKVTLQGDIGILAKHFQQVPDLLLASVMAPPFTAHPTGGHVVMKPVAGSPNNFHMMGL